VARALAKEIPLHERIITAEDTPEFGRSIPHRNRVSLLYDKHGKGPGPTKLVEAALRMRIGRFMFQELRDGPATLAFMAVLNSGHAGSITTLHAGSAADAFDRLRLMVKETQAGAAMADTDIIARLRALIDVVIHCDLSADGRRVREVLWTGAPS
jgi:type IV secretion system protein VirB11